MNSGEFARKLFAGPCDFIWGTGSIDSLPRTTVGTSDP